MNQVAKKTLDEGIESWREELGGYLKLIPTFQRLPIHEILKMLSAWSGRAYYIRSKVVRSTASSAQTFRTQEVDQFIQAVDTQFKIWSRAQSGMKDEWEMSR